MIDKKDLALMDDLIDAVTASSAWQQILADDLNIQKTGADFDTALEKVMQYIPANLQFELEDAVRAAHVCCLNALEYVAILYGIHAADVIRAVSASPGELSQYILDRIAAACCEVEK